MSTPQSTDQQGEGFAFFRWHALTFATGTGTCSYPKRDNVCAREWDFMNPEALAALENGLPKW